MGAEKMGAEFTVHGLAKSQKTSFFVIPAPHQVRDKLQPESSVFRNLSLTWTPAFAGVTTFHESVKVQIKNSVYQIWRDEANLLSPTDSRIWCQR